MLETIIWFTVNSGKTNRMKSKNMSTKQPALDNKFHSSTEKKNRLKFTLMQDGNILTKWKKHLKKQT